MWILFVVCFLFGYLVKDDIFVCLGLVLGRMFFVLEIVVMMVFDFGLMVLK